MHRVSEKRAPFFSAGKIPVITPVLATRDVGKFELDLDHVLPCLVTC